MCRNGLQGETMKPDQTKPEYKYPGTMSVAFAMGGLAGNNAHGAGFLQAALDRHIKPIMISCTSGQLLWVKRYLQVATGEVKKNLREMLQEDIREVNPTGNKNYALAKLALFGKSHVFAPAYLEWTRDLNKNARDVWHDLLKKPEEVSLVRGFLELFPCRHLVPSFPAEFFKDISDYLRDAELPQGNEGTSPVGIVFNSYNPQSGEEYVYLNGEARKRLNEKSGKPNKYGANQKNEYRDRTIYQDIDAQAVCDALWLYQYGFDRKGSSFVDGAYFRGVILSELAVADRIFCVRPINHHWQGHLPRNYPELEDLKTEIGFDGAYCGERYQIELINKLLDKKKMVEGEKYHNIDLQELEIRQPRGFFDYVFESEKVYDDAYEDAMKLFDGLGYAAAPEV